MFGAESAPTAPLVLVMAARAVHTRVVDRVPPADRVSPPPAPVSVRPTPLCHIQSQTERSLSP